MSAATAIRRTVKDAVLAALSLKPRRPAAERNWEPEQSSTQAGVVFDRALAAQGLDEPLTDERERLSLDPEDPDPHPYGKRKAIDHEWHR